MRALRIIALASLVVLGGCAGLGWDKSVFDGGLSITATVQNPVTLEQQAAVELSYNAAAIAVVTYARLPRCKGQSGPCSSWAVVQKLKAANRLAYSALTRMRDFLDNNQRVSASSAFNAAVKALREFRAIAFINGIQVPSN